MSDLEPQLRSVAADHSPGGAPLDPLLLRLRDGLAAHRRRLWLRRIVGRTWIVGAALLAAETALAGAARLVALEAAPTLAAALPALAVLALLVETVRVRPTLAEAALAVDVEAGLADRLSSALELAVAWPRLAGPEGAADGVVGGDGEAAEIAEAARLVRRQRRDAVAAAVRVPPGLFGPRLARRPALAGLVATLLLVPLVLLPNPQDAVLAQRQALRDAATHQADRLERLADDLAKRGPEAQDPRTRLAQELRDLALQLRERPTDLDVNLARLGGIEDDLRAQLDPANEQRAASLASLSRSLSRTATGRPEANREGAVEQARADLAALGAQLETKTPGELQRLAADLAAQQSTADAADGAAAAALRDAAQSLGQGDRAGAQRALQRLGDALTAAADQVATRRDLASAASQLQETRRQLADAGGQAAIAAASGQGQAGASPGPGSSGSGQGPAGSPGASGPGQGQGQGQGQGGSQSSNQGSLGGGGSNAAYLGSGVSGGPGFNRPTGANRPSQVGPDLSTVYAPFDRLGKPGDPSYVAGTGGDGQTQRGDQTGGGATNAALVPYQQVFSTFQQYAMTSLERAYVPLAVKDYVRDYFTSLDPTR